MFIKDPTTNTTFLIDTGADISVIPNSKNLSTTLANLDQPLYAANGTRIQTFGDTTLVLGLGLHRSFRWRFVIADVSQAIIGADFLQHFGLLVDFRNRKLTDALTQLSVSATSNSIQREHIIIKTVNITSPFQRILLEFPKLTRPLSNQFMTATTSAQHQIITKGHPIHSKFRRLDSIK